MKNHNKGSVALTIGIIATAFALGSVAMFFACPYIKEKLIHQKKPKCCEEAEPSPSNNII